MRAIVLALGLCLLFVSAGCMACVGARPLSMGGAFIGLADDVNATYWNPAGLARLDKPQATIMYTATNRDEINYQSYSAVAGRIPGTNAGYGFSYVSNHADLGAGGLDAQNWYWLSGAYKLKDAYVGLNVRFINDSIAGLSTGTAIDLSFLKVVDDKWSIGLLVQDFNEPRMQQVIVSPYTTGSVTVATHFANVRPGVAYRPDKNTILTADIYDLMDRSGMFALRLGAERILHQGLAVRAGYYGAGDMGGLTLGVGGKVGKFQADAALMSGDLDNTVLVSVTGQY